MKDIFFKKVTWDGENLIVDFNREYSDEICLNAMNLEIVNRETKDTLPISFDFDYLLQNNQIKLNLPSLLLNISNGNVFDLYISNGSKAKKLTKSGYKIKDKQLRFLEPIYMLNDYLGFIPYLTTNSEIAILCASKRDIRLRYCNILNEYIEIYNLKSNGTNLVLNIPSIDFNNFEDYNIVCVDKGNNKINPLNFSLSKNQGFCELSIEVSDQTDWNLNKEYNLYLEAKYGKSIIRMNFYMYPDGESLVDNISFGNNLILVPYRKSADNGIFAFYVTEYHIEQGKKYKLKEKYIANVHLTIKRNNLDIKLINPDIGEIINQENFVWDKVKFLIDDNRTFSFETQIDNMNDITIDLNVLFNQNTLSEMNKFDCYLKFYYKNEIYKVLLKNYFDGIDRYLKPVRTVNDSYVGVHLTKSGDIHLIYTKNIESYKNISLPYVREHIEIDNLKFTSEKMTFSFRNHGFIDQPNMNFVAYNENTDEVYVFEDVSKQGDNIEIELMSFLERYSSKKTKWNVCIKIVQSEFIELIYLGLVNSDYLPKYQRFFDVIYTGDKHIVVPYLSNKNKLELVIDEAKNIRRLPKKIKKSKINIDKISVEERTLSFNIKYNNIEQIPGKVSFYLVNRKTKDKYYLNNIYISDNGRVNLNLNSFINEQIEESSRWNLFSEIVYDNFIETSRVGSFNNTEKEKYKRYYDLFAYEGKNTVAPYLTNKNELSIVIRDKRFYYPEKYEIKTFINKLDLKSQLLTGQLVIDVPSVNNYQVEELTMKLRSKVEDEEYSIPFSEMNSQGNKKRINFRIDLKDYTLKQFYYEFYIILDINGERAYKRIEKSSQTIKEKINKSVLKNNYITPEKCIIYPFITPKDVLFLAYRQMAPEESVSDRVNELVAYPLFRLLKNFLNKKDIWLVYEKNSETAQDNSFYFFKYCYENHYDKNVYYVIKKNSPDFINLKGMEDRVIDFMSIKHLVYMCAAKLLVASETRGHLYLWRHQKGKIKEILNKKKFVFLQHGVTAFKLNDSVLRRDSDSAVNLYVVTSDYERDIISKGLGYSKDEIIVTGFTRWDYLVDKSQNVNPKEIFLMPTWRGWLDEVPEDEFIETPYYKNYMEVLNSDKLHGILRDKNIKLNFFIHPKFKQYISNFSSNCENIRVISFGEEKVNELLMRSSMLITDYSSVAWETYYLKKPVVFYQFDIQDYNRLTGSYVNMDEGLFGDRVFNSVDLVETIESYVKNDFAEKQVYANDRAKYFKYIDQNNSKRVYDEILNSKVLFGSKKKSKSKYFKLKKNKLIVLMWNVAKKNKLTHLFARKGKDAVKKLVFTQK